MKQGQARLQKAKLAGAIGEEVRAAQMCRPTRGGEGPREKLAAS
jgi:hypothetical protein